MFQGFSDRTIDFMWGIRFNNEKSWFEANKETYLRDFYQPMRELNREVWERLNAAAPDLGLFGKVSHIYRDARRLHGRGPYKDHLWWSIQRPTDEEFARRPVLWFELEPEGWSYGMGYYQAPPVTMAKLRHRLDHDPAPFEKLVRQIKKQDRFTLETEDYKRPKGHLNALLDPWYNARSFALSRDHKGHQPVLYSHDLVDLVGEDLETLLPIYRYILSVEADPDPRN